MCCVSFNVEHTLSDEEYMYMGMHLIETAGIGCMNRESAL